MSNNCHYVESLTGESTEQSLKSEKTFSVFFLRKCQTSLLWNENKCNADYFSIFKNYAVFTFRKLPGVLDSFFQNFYKNSILKITLLCWVTNLLFTITLRSKEKPFEILPK